MPIPVVWWSGSPTKGLLDCGIRSLSTSAASRSSSLTKLDDQQLELLEGAFGKVTLGKVTLDCSFG